MSNFWNSIFNNKDKNDEEKNDSSSQPETITLAGATEITKPLSEFPQDLLGQKPIEVSKEGFLPQLVVGSAQSVGRQRDHNEDTLFTLSTTFASYQGNFPFGIFIIADGMGGHQHGEIASKIATLTMVEHINKYIFSKLFKEKAANFEGSLKEILENGVQESHENILKNASGGGTTLTVVIILDQQLAIAHVGDSRVYSFANNGTLKPLTRDHSFVSRLVELGQITPAEAAVHPRRNVLYRALGQVGPADPEIIIKTVPQNESLIICSDGLWGEVSDQEISEIAKNATTPQNACQSMVDLANAAGGPDNISAIMVKMP